MKKALVIISVIAVASLLVFCFLSGIGASEPTVEAELTVTVGTTVTARKGTVADLTSEIMAGLSPSEATEYKLSLLSDSEGLGNLGYLNGNGNAKVIVELGGYTIYNNKTEPLIHVGNISGFEMNGGFNEYAKSGAISEVGTSSSLLKIEKDSPAKVVFRDLSASSKLGASDGRYIVAEGGSLKFINTSLTFSGDYAAEPILVRGASLVFGNSSVIKTEGKVASVPAIKGVSATVRFENSSLNTKDNSVDLDGASYFLAVNGELRTEGAVFTTTDTTMPAVHIAGTAVYAKTAATAEGIVNAWYGTGTTYFECTDGTANVTVASNKGSFAPHGEGMKLATTRTEAAVLTVFADGVAPTETYGSHSSLFSKFSSATPDTPTVYVMTLLADLSWPSKSASSVSKGHVNVTVFYALNGHTITKSAYHSVMLSGSGDQKLYFTGNDIDGNRGKYVNTHGGQFFYGKNMNPDAFLSVSDIDFTYQNNTDNGAPVFQPQGGYCYFKDVSFNYTGELIPEAPTKTSFTAVMLQDTAKVVFRDSRVTSVTDKKASMQGITISGSEYAVVDNSIISTKSALTTSSTRAGWSAIVHNSKVSSPGTPYRNSKSSCIMKVVDTETVTGSGTVADAGTYFLIGTGKNVVKTSSPSVSGGQFENDKYRFFPTGDGESFTISYTSISLPEIYTNGMVLQAKKELQISGECETEGATVEVVIGDYRAEAPVIDGRFTVKFTEGLPYMKGVTVTIGEKGGVAQPVNFYDVDLGEIWLMSGQSNSVYDISLIEDFPEYLANADNFDNIKAYIVPQKSSMVELESTGAKWYNVDSAFLSKLASTSQASRNSVGLSGIAYVAATRLATELPDATIAIIDCNFNGSGVQTWMDYDVACEYAPDYASQYKPYYDYYVANGKYPTSSDINYTGSFIASDKLYSRMPTACYNAMVRPMDGFSIAGAIWYQGEGNGGDVTSTSDGGYYARFRAVRETFRRTFADAELPTFIIQIPPYFSSLADFKNLQYKMASDEPNTHIVAATAIGPTLADPDFAISDLGDSVVHFARKSPLGLALAAEILENVYKIDEDKGAPKIESTKVSASAVKTTVTITFDRPLTMLWGTSPEGFELAGSDGEYKKAIAKLVDEYTIELYAPGLASPKSVRYGYGVSVFEMEDGTLIPLSKSAYTFTDTEENGVRHITITDKATGEKLYDFYSNDTYIIRAHSLGNIASDSGQTMPNFRIDL